MTTTSPSLQLDASLSEADRAFALRAQQGLRASEPLDYVESARLSAARALAMAAIAPARARPSTAWLAAPVAIAAVALLSFPRTAQTPLPQAAAVVLVNQIDAEALNWGDEPAGPQFYRDLAFYQWLQTQDSHKPNA